MDSKEGRDVQDVQDGKFLLQTDSVMDKTYIVAFGVSAVEGYEEIKFYTSLSETDLAVHFSRHQDNKDRKDHKDRKDQEDHKDQEDSKDVCFLHVKDNPNVWSGAPFIAPIVNHHIDLTQWIETYSEDILISSYQMLDQSIGSTSENENDGESTGDNNLLIETRIDHVKTLPNGFQMIGTIRGQEPKRSSGYSIQYVVNLYQQPKLPMVGRVGDSRIGYFYDNFRIDTTKILAGQPIALINKMNLKKTPWIYIIDRSIPIEYHKDVKSGILSWNKYFDKLGLGAPFQVICGHDSNYPDEIDVFDMTANYIVATNAENFNGPYSGYSMYISDHRSGEILFGVVSINLIKTVSLPMRYVVMHGYEPEQGHLFKKEIDQYIAWVITHEVGHQLGLRHNFTGTFTKNHTSTVMDYVDIFNDLTTPSKYNPWGTLREYDLNAIKYGYVPLKGEQTGIKHPQLDTIAQKMTVPFGTDENYWEDINPLVNKVEDVDNPLEFVEKNLRLYHEYRVNLLKFVKDATITSYEYNNLFIYLYTDKYIKLSDICLKYIGGRYYDPDRVYFQPISKSSVVQAITLLLHILKEIEYTSEEYQYFVYESDLDTDYQLYNHVQFDTIYSMNHQNLYNFYLNLINHILKGITSAPNIIRLVQNTPDTMTATDLLSNFSFSFISSSKSTQVYDVHSVNGIFPEIGAVLIHDSHWQDILLDFSPLKANLQYNWIDRLLDIYKNTDSYLMKSSTYTILKQVDQITNQSLLPYLSTLKDRSKTSKTQLMEHWSFLRDILKPIRVK